MPPASLSTSTPGQRHDCPTTTVTPDSNGWVPLGTCGYLNRPYYPSFTVAIIFAVAATAVLVGHILWTLRLHRRHQHRFFYGVGRKEALDEDVRGKHSHLVLPCLALFTSACLVVAYVARAIGTRNQQEPMFVAVSDTLVLLCPMLVFVFNCGILMTLINISTAEYDRSGGLTRRGLTRLLILTVPPLAAEQLIAAVLIAPRHRPSAQTDWKSTDTAMLGLQLYLAGIGVQGLLVLYTFAPAVALYRKLRTGKDTVSCRRVCQAFFFSQTAIFLRVAYRLIELSSFFTGYLRFLAHHEVFFYTMECLPVLAGLGVWTFVCLDHVLDNEVCSRYDIRLDSGSSEAMPLASQQELEDG